ncbi:MAG: SWIM zinc finger family protein, partial [Proteobacteria bacterium]|nr:SWIM zinc finger family protein [Pseudomonadota bacterium]
MTALDQISQKTLVEWLGANEVAKGLGYIGRVSELSSNDFSVSARVKGTKRTPYSVYMEVAEGRNGLWRLMSDCTCPVGRNCKHVAAMMLAWLRQRGSPERPREQVLAWIEALRGAVGGQDASGAARRRSATSHGLVYLLASSSAAQPPVVR